MATKLKKTFWTVLKEWALVTLGIIIYTMGWSIFLVPNNLVGGGVTGISSIIQYATGGAIKIGYSYFVLNTRCSCTGSLELLVLLEVVSSSRSMKDLFA